MRVPIEKNNLAHFRYHPEKDGETIRKNGRFSDLFWKCAGTIRASGMTGTVWPGFGEVRET
jgi:hypothetical protein